MGEEEEEEEEEEEINSADSMWRRRPSFKAGDCFPCV